MIAIRYAWRQQIQKAATTSRAGGTKKKGRLKLLKLIDTIEGSGAGTQASKEWMLLGWCWCH